MSAAGYNLVCPIAYGIWKATDLNQNRNVAIKMVDKALPTLESCRKCLEKLVAEPLVHENIDQVYACFNHEKYFWVVSELGEYGSARTIMNATFPKNTGFDEETCRAILHQVAEALQFLHNNRVFHRDVCAANFLLCQGGVCKLAGNYAIHASEVSRELVGSLTHAAPEIVWGTDYSEPCDIWSFGISIIELLQGFAPNDDLSPPVKIVQAIVHGDIPELPQSISSNISQDTALLIQRALQKDATIRPSAGALAEMLPDEDSKEVIAAFLEENEVGTANDSFRFIYPEISDDNMPPNVYPPQNPESRFPRAQISEAIGIAKSTMVKKKRFSQQVDAQSAPVLSAVPSNKDDNPDRKNSEVKKMGKFTVTTTAPAERKKSNPSSNSTVQLGKFTVTTTTHAKAEGETGHVVGPQAHSFASAGIRTQLESIILEQKDQGKSIIELVTICSKSFEEIKDLQSQMNELRSEMLEMREENSRLRDQIEN